MNILSLVSTQLRSNATRSAYTTATIFSMRRIFTVPSYVFRTFGSMLNHLNTGGIAQDFPVPVNGETRLSMLLKAESAVKGINRFNLGLIRPINTFDINTSSVLVSGSCQARIELMAPNNSTEVDRIDLIRALIGVLEEEIVNQSWRYLVPMYES